jgi:dCTP deaminase
LVNFKTAIERRFCEPCQRGQHGACGYLVEMEELNQGAVDAEDFISVRQWCACYNSLVDMHHEQREARHAEARFVEEIMDRPLAPVHASVRAAWELRHLDQGGVLSDTSIRIALSAGTLMITPFHEDDLGPSSYDLTLHPEIGEIDLPSVVDLMNVPMDYIRRCDMRDTVEGYYDLRPGEFILASTVQTVGLDACFAARVEGKSSLARLGLAVHVTGGFIDPGFEGQITLEMVNLSSSVLRLWPNIPIAQIAFIPIAGMVERPYSVRGNYQHQRGPTASRYTP